MVKAPSAVPNGTPRQLHPAMIKQNKYLRRSARHRPATRTHIAYVKHSATTMTVTTAIKTRTIRAISGWGPPRSEFDESASLMVNIGDTEAATTPHAPRSEKPP